MKKKKLAVLSLLLAVLSVAVICACKTETPVYTVTLDYGTQFETATKQVEEGEKLDAAQLAKESLGYVLAGWYRDSAFTTPWNFDTDTVTENTTLYAKWDMDTTSFTVTFYYNREGYDVFKTAKVRIGEKPARPGTPRVPSVLFTDWYKDAECTEKYDFGAVAADESVYAGWREGVKDGSLTYLLNEDGTGYIITATQNLSGKVSLPISYKELPVVGLDSDALSGQPIVSLTLPATLTFVNEGALSGLTSLTELYTPFIGSGDILIKGGLDYMFGKEDVPSALVKVSVSGESIINSDAIVDVPSLLELEIVNCEMIANGAIKNVSSLNKLVVQNAGTIGFGAIEGCDNLTSVTLPYCGSQADEARNAQFGYIFGVNDPYRDNITLIPQNIKEIVVKGGTRIANDTMYGLSRVEEMTLPYIGTGLDAVNEESVFASIFSSVKYDDSLVSAESIDPNKPYYYANSSFADINGVRKTKAFYLPASLTKVTITGGKLTFGAFSWCDSLRDISIPTEGMTEIPPYAFQSIPFFESFEFPSTVKKVGENAFYFCEGLKSVKLNEGLEYIGAEAFSYCEILDRIDIPATVTVIDNSAFAGCFRLTDVVIPEGVQKLGYGLFMSCSSLRSLSIPASAADIYRDSETGAIMLTYLSVKLEKFTVAEDNPILYSLNGILMDKETDEILVIPPLVKGDFVFPEGPSSIPAGLFSDCPYITSITLPDTVTTVGSDQFNRCTSLKKVTFGREFKEIGEYSFDNCSAELDWGDSTPTEFGSYTFFGYAGQSLTLPASVVSLGIYAFYGVRCPVYWAENTQMRNIDNFSFMGYFGTSLTLPDCIETIGNSAFADCYYLTEIHLPANLYRVNGGAFNKTPVYNEIMDAVTEGPVYMDDILLAYKGKIASDQRIEILDGTKVIGASVFSGQFDMTAVSLPSTLTYIGESAFYNCQNLLSVELPDSLREIGENAFRYCYGLKSVILPTALESMKYAFSYCSGEISFKEGMIDTLPTGAFTAYSGEMRIPQTITTIQPYAFQMAEGSVVWEGTPAITELGTNAFSIFYGEELTIPESVTSIGAGCFSNSTQLRKLEFPAGLTSIGYNAFNGISSLRLLKFNSPQPPALMPGKDEKVGLFDNLYVRIVVPAGCLEAYKNAPGWAPYARFLDEEDIDADDFMIDNGTLVTYSGHDKSVTIPDTVTEIGSFAFFNNADLEILYIPAGVKKIDEAALFGCDRLRVVYLGCAPDIEAHEFLNNSANKTVIIVPAGTEKTYKGGNSAFFIYRDGIYGEQDIRNDFLYKYNTVTNERILQKYVGTADSAEIGEYDTIAAYAFYNTTLKSLSLGGTVRVVKDYAFMNNRFLTDVDFGDSVVNLGYRSFKNCPSLKAVELPDTVTTLGENSFGSCTAVERLRLPDGIVKIGDDCFSSLYSLTELELPSSVTELGTGAFYSCRSLVSLTLNEGLITIGSGVFSNCSRLTELVVPASVKTLGQQSFSNCTALTDITLKGKTSVGISTFSECKSLKEIDLTNAASLGVYAFNNCTSLTSVTFGPEIAEIPAYAFYLCAEIKEIDCPASLQSIGDFAFGFNSKLTRVTFNDGLRYLGNNAFHYCVALKEIEMPDTVTSMGEMVFNNCYNITRAVLSDNLERIGEKAFLYCYALKEVTMPKNLYVIGGYAFSYCHSLQTIDFSTVNRDTDDGLDFQLIGEYSFYHCINLRSIHIPSTVLFIYAYAFAECYGLEEVTFEEGLMKIYSEAFRNCVSLKTLTLPSTMVSINGRCFKGCFDLKTIYVKRPRPINGYDWLESWDGGCGAEIIWDYKG